MKITLVIATHNQHKLEEINKILCCKKILLKTLADFPAMPKVVEDGKTLEDNAIKKALAITKAFNLPALADDSGLFVPALNNQPGVKSARYAGPDCDYAQNNNKLLNNMQKLTRSKRKAYFATCIALSWPNGRVVTRLGKIWGDIPLQPCGEQGFGYDPIFIPRGNTKTFAQMSARKKNQLSHRALALRKIKNILDKI